MDKSKTEGMANRESLKGEPSPSRPSSKLIAVCIILMVLMVIPVLLTLLGKQDQPAASGEWAREYRKTFNEEFGIEGLRSEKSRFTVELWTSFENIDKINSFSFSEDQRFAIGLRKAVDSAPKAFIDLPKVGTLMADMPNSSGWVHLAATYAPGRELVLFVNGKKVDSISNLEDVPSGATGKFRFSGNIPDDPNKLIYRDWPQPLASILVDSVRLSRAVIYTEDFVPERNLQLMDSTVSLLTMEKNKNDAEAKAADQRLATPRFSAGRWVKVDTLDYVLAFDKYAELDREMFRRLADRGSIPPAKLEEYKALWPSIPYDKKCETRKLYNNEIMQEHVTNAMKRWMEKHKPVWFDVTRPQDLNDRDIGDLWETLGHRIPSRERKFHGVERTKISLLVLLEPKRSLEYKRRAFENLVSYLRGMYLFADEYRKAMERLVHLEGLPTKFKSYAYYMLLQRLAQYDLTEDYGELAKLPLFKTLTLDQTKWLERTTKLNEFDRLSYEEQKVAVDKVDDEYKAMFLERLSYRAMYEEEFEQSRSFIEESWEAKKGKGIYSERWYKRELGWVKRAVPLRKLLKELMVRFPCKTSAPAYMKPDSLNAKGMKNQDEVAARARHLVRTKRVLTFNTPEMYVEYLAFVRDVHHADDMVKTYLRKGVQSVEDDFLRSRLVERLTGLIDAHDKTEREWIFALLQPYDDATVYPKTHVAIVQIRLEVSLKAGTETDMSQVCEIVKKQIKDQKKSRPRSYSRPSELALLALRYGILHDDAKLLKQILGNAPDDWQKNTRFMKLALKAYRLCGMEQEFGAAKTMAEALLEDKVAETWTGYPYAMEVIRLSKTIGERPRYPREWLKFLLAKTRSPQQSMELALADAQHRGDTKAMEELAESYLKSFPNQYSAYRYRALAHMANGRTEEAIAALTTYLEHCKDELEYPSSVNLLKQLKSIR